jgi:hypothetical protein
MTFGSVFGRTFSPTFQPKSQATGGIVGGTVTVGAAADTWLNNGSPFTYNYGGGTFLGLNKPDVRKILFRFNLSSIPASATCTAAKITVTLTSTTYGTRYFSAYEIAAANGDWVEGTANGTAETGSPCWNYKAYHASTPTAWAGSGGLSTAGTDYVNTLIAQNSGAAASANNPIDIVFNASGLTVVKSWFGQSTNSGVVIWYDTGTNVGFHSKEATTESYRPTLTVTYE